MFFCPIFFYLNKTLIHSICYFCNKNRRISYINKIKTFKIYEILMNKDLSNIDYIAMELHWQMGEEKYKELLDYVSKFFKVSGNTNFIVDRNTLIYLSK